MDTIYKDTSLFRAFYVVPTCPYYTTSTINAIISSTFSASTFVVVMINFDPITYNVNEGDTANLTVRLSVPSAVQVTVDIATIPGSATGQ